MASHRKAAAAQAAGKLKDEIVAIKTPDGRIDADGCITEYPLPRAGARLRGIACTTDGNLLMTASEINMILRMNTNGVVLAEYPVPTKRAGLRALTVIPDGRAFFAESEAGRIGELVEI